jgi:hypothetical protein
VSDELLEGLTAYGREQEWRETKTSDMLLQKWAPIRLLGRAFRARETAAGTAVVIPLQEGDESSDDEDDDEEGRPARATTKFWSEFPFWDGCPQRAAQGGKAKWAIAGYSGADSTDARGTDEGGRERGHV